MQFHLTALVALTAAAASTLAAPSPPTLHDLTCTCLTLHPASPPTPCHFLSTPGFGWRSAHLLAAQYDMPLRFARPSTVTRVLAIPAPLPSEALRVAAAGDAETVAQRGAARNEIVCGFRGEVEGLGVRGPEQEGFVAKVIAWLVLMVVVWAAGERVWCRWFGRVRLHGPERRLLVGKAGEDALGLE